MDEEKVKLKRDRKKKERGWKDTDKKERKTEWKGK